MIRFRNPVSDMDILIKNFKKIYEEFSDLEYFNLDDIANFFAANMLASSSGYVGTEAHIRSYSIKDNSRNQMRNQAKSYTEVYKFLGWITTSNGKALNFSFTFLGVHVASSGVGAKKLFEQCLLGIEYPNNILKVKFKDKSKPFINILRFAYSLDSKINRDEILLGPMSIVDEEQNTEIDNKIQQIKNLRKSKNIVELSNEIEKLAQANRMKVYSVRNLTRFVISALKYVEWFEKKKLKIYGKTTDFLVLTEKGKEVYQQIMQSRILSGRNLNLTDPNTAAISELSLLLMFKRADFNVDNELKKHNKLFKKICCTGESDIIFSPYQYFSKTELDKVLPSYVVSGSDPHNTLKNIMVDTDCQSIEKIDVKADEFYATRKNSLVNEINKYIQESKNNIEEAIDNFVKSTQTMKQNEFYPLVADLFSIVFSRDAFAPSAGNNNLRFDVIIPDEHFSIPVEVKSPTEEMMLSVKAIRQALENKIILLSRKPFVTSFEISSFACGYSIPNTRSDVYRLIEEIYKVYRINIAIIDIQHLVKVAFYCVKNNKVYNIESFKNRRGIINFEIV
jgi:hypothetical protein